MEYFWASLTLVGQYGREDPKKFLAWPLCSGFFALFGRKDSPDGDVWLIGLFGAFVGRSADAGGCFGFVALGRKARKVKGWGSCVGSKEINAFFLIESQFWIVC